MSRKRKPSSRNPAPQRQPKLPPLPPGQPPALRPLWANRVRVQGGVAGFQGWSRELLVVSVSCLGSTVGPNIAPFESQTIILGPDQAEELAQQLLQVVGRVRVDPEGRTSEDLIHDPRDWSDS